MIFPIDGFVGKSDGEDLFYEKMHGFLPQDYVSFHNKDIGMEEADVILLVPNRGILVIEIKSFRPYNILKARDDKYILKMNGDVEFSPFKQAARYRDSLVAKLKAYDKGYDRFVIAHVPCFPFFSEQDLISKEMGKICDIELFITGNDLISFSNFSKRLDVIFECANKVNIPGLKKNYFPYESIIEVANIIMPNSVDKNDFATNVAKDNRDNTKDICIEYSHIFVRCDEGEETDEKCNEIVEKWKSGTKIFYYSNDKKSIEKIKYLLDKEIADFIIKTYPDKYKELNISDMREEYGYFNFTIEYSLSINESFEIINGQMSDEQIVDVKKLGQYVHFNSEQFLAEHADTKNMLVNAGAGTGKTYLLVSRIAYLIWKHNYSADELRRKIALITFTNDATNEMRSRLEMYFSKMFIITFDKRYYEYIQCVENMTISTIDSFSKKIVSRFSYNLGLGSKLNVTSATLIKQKYVREEINDYLLNTKKSSELAISSYDMTKLLLELIKKIEDRNKDPRKIQMLFDKSFNHDDQYMASVDTMTRAEYVKKDLEALFLRVPKIMLKIEEECSKHNHMVMGEIIVYLGRVVDQIKDGVIEKPVDVCFEYVFIDEFQDTDDQQITLVAEFQKLFDFKLFVVGDVKQSIYRFRGANDDQAFRLLLDLCDKDFLSYDLIKNYRTNSKLLDYFDTVFKALHSKKGKRKSKGLLAYEEKDVLKGVKNPNYPAQIERYYFTSDEEREKRICEVIQNHTPEKGTMAILVRKNYQVAEIKRICQKNDIYNVDIDTGGSLYQHEASIDLFKLAYALQNNKDGEALFNLYTTSYVNESLDKNELMKTEDKEQYFVTHLPSSLSNWESYVDKLQTEPVLRVIREIIDFACPWNIYSQRLKCGEHEREIATLRYRNNLDKLFEKIAIETNGLYLTLNSLVESLRIMITTSQEEDERPVTESFSIQCRTVHRSKGKEYDYIFLPYADDTFEKGKPKYNNTFIICNEGIGYFLPIDGVEYKNRIFEQEDAKEREEQSYEEARVFYVALTRAKTGIIYLETEKKNRFQTSWFEMLKEQ